MGKLPSFQFYPGDWMKDPALRACSLEARGLWTDMLCLMHENDRRGYLQVNGKPVSNEQLARMTGCSTEQVARCLQELVSSGVASESEHGLYSRRMVRDEHKRMKCSDAGKKGGNPTLKGHSKGDSKGDDKPKPTPSSSSSSSSSDKTTQHTTTRLEGVVAADARSVIEGNTPKLDDRVQALCDAGIAWAKADKLVRDHLPTLEQVESAVANSRLPGVVNRQGFIVSAIRENYAASPKTNAADEAVKIMAQWEQARKQA